MKPVRPPRTRLISAAVAIWATAVVAVVASVPLALALANRTVQETPSPTPDVTATPTRGSSTANDAVRGNPPALVTDTGAPVVVLDRSSDGRYVVTTPCGRRATISGGTPLLGATVVIDPGHGGQIDTGAVQNGIIERDLNLDVANALAAELRGRGIGVVLTRTFDYGATLATRAALADALRARLMVSIHHNSSPSPPPTSSEPGTEVFVQSSGASRRLGALLYEHVTSALAAAYSIDWYHVPDAGVLRVTQPDGQETYGMIRNPSTTTALIEMGWLSNPAEADAVYASPTYLPIAASALADAVEEYLAGSSPEGVSGHRTFTARPARGTDECTDPALE